MKLVTFIKAGERRVGAVLDDGIIDLTRRLGIASVKQVIADGRLAEAERETKADLPLAQVTLDLPLPDPGKILCVGVNYLNRNAEYKDGSEAPKYPSLFMRTPLSFVAPGQSLVIPRESAELDYEGEIVLVIGKSGRRITQADAMRHVAGLTIMNEGSVRDWIRHGKFNVTQGKNFDRSGSFGPWIETDLKRLDLDHLRLETRVNGELRQSDTTASMTFSFARIIEYVSTFTTLLPGDLIATGTPTGSGGRFDPPKWLKEGDVVDVTVEGLGALKNGVTRE
jgi:2-keto-4-pentenoate hydratase/2-oxohepta-3-ene-1,7-dioic acid hydratase in catechol pathway